MAGAFSSAFSSAFGNLVDSQLTDVAGEIADYLIAQGYTNTRSSTEWPTVVGANLVLEESSPSPTGFFTADAEIRYVSITVLCRGENPGEVRTRALAIYDLLRYHAALGLRSIGQPYPIGIDGDGHPQYAIAFEAKLLE